MGKSIRDAIQELEAEIAEKQAILNALYKIDGETPGVPVINSSIQQQPDSKDSGNPFPKNSRTDSQVMWLFDNVFKVPQKYSTIQRKFNELLGAEKNVYNVCRTLKKLGLLATVQYNKQNKLSFWGKQEWVGESDFKADFKPSIDELPFQIFDTKILTDEEELVK